MVKRGKSQTDPWPAAAIPAPATVPTGTRVYAIGDIHGCLEKLVSLHYAVAKDLAARPVARSVLVHLGDFVDRGRDSAGVLWLLSGPIAAKTIDLRVDLLGNHESMMLEALAENASDETVTLWLDNGGIATLKSYGLQPHMPRAQWREIIPAQHLTYMRNLALSHHEGGYLFVHAGIRPGIALPLQSRDDMLWIRDPFLYDRTAHPLVVVHGHSMVRTPEILSNRIAIDTGAVMGNPLSCLVLEEDNLRFLTA